MNTEWLARLSNLSVGYESPVIEEINLEIRAGDFIGLLGPNGSGKTTLLKTIAGILKPLAGDVVFNEEYPSTVGYVPQKESLNPEFLLSGYEVVLMGTYGRKKLFKPVTREEKDFVIKCLQLVDAELFARKPFFELSGGQRQRILIARALAAKPRLLLLDEPIAGVDLPTAQSIMELLVKLRTEQGIAIVFVTHDISMTLRYANDTFVIHQNRLLKLNKEELRSADRIETLLNVYFG